MHLGAKLIGGARPWYPNKWSNIILEIPVKMFLDWLTFKLVESECNRKFFTMWVGLIQSAESLSKMESCKPMAFGLELKHQLLFVSPAWLPLDLNYSMGSALVSSLPAHPADLALPAFTRELANFFR